MHQRSSVAALLASALLVAPHTGASAQPTDDQRVTAALSALKPQRAGVVDAYVVVIALDSDPVFSREAREAGRVLASRLKLDPSDPQLSTGSETSNWLARLEERKPFATSEPVGQTVLGLGK